MEARPGDRTVPFTLDDKLDLDGLLAIYKDADAGLVRAIWDAHTHLNAHLVPVGRTLVEVVGPLLVALRALEHAFFLALGGESPVIQTKRYRRSAAALVVISGRASPGVMDSLRGPSTVADYVAETINDILALDDPARSEDELVPLWDAAGVCLYPVLPRLVRLDLGTRHDFISKAVRSLLKKGHPKRPSGTRHEHLFVLLKHGGVSFADAESLKVALHNHQVKLPPRS